MTIKYARFVMASWLVLGACGDDDDDDDVELDAGDNVIGADAGEDAATGERDAGIDGGAVDAGALDAGERDAGSLVDAGPADAGGETDGGDAGPAPVSFGRVYAIISDNCAPCHTEQNAGNLDMSSQASAFDELVLEDADGFACSGAGRVRVVPGSTATSLLFQKISGTQDCGSRMPLNRAPLSDALIEEIGSWIEAGAAED